LMDASGHGSLFLRGDAAVRGIFDRLLLLACCSATLPGKMDDVTTVVAMLASTTVAAINGYSKSRPILTLSVVSYTTASIIWPAFCLFSPLVQYDSMAESQKTGKGAWLIAAAGSLVVCFASIPISASLMVASLMAVAYVLAIRTAAAEQSEYQARQLRDNSHEMAVLLRQKNRELIEKQDYDVRMATLNERGRIAREIHDHVGHLLSRSILQVGALMVTKTGERELENLSAIRDTLTQAMDRIRASVHDLHEESIDLRTQVGALAREFAFCPIRLDYELEGDPEKDIAYCFIAIIKEGLSNIIRHSDATQVTLRLLEHPALYQLVLQDNGGGWTGGSGEGLGLRSIRERVDALGGHLVVEATGGFRLFISVPKRRGAA